MGKSDIAQKMVDIGQINVSPPELTALDIFRFKVSHHSFDFSTAPLCGTREGLFHEAF